MTNTNTNETEQAETVIVQNLVEWFLNNPDVNAHVNKIVTGYCEAMGFDVKEQMTEIQQELFCQYQLTIYHRIFAKAIANVL